MCNSMNNNWQNVFFVKKLISIHGFFDACLQQSGKINIYVSYNQGSRRSLAYFSIF